MHGRGKKNANVDNLENSKGKKFEKIRRDLAVVGVSDVYSKRDTPSQTNAAKTKHNILSMESWAITII